MLRSLFSATKSTKAAKQTMTLEIGGRPVDIIVRQNARAKRYTLRLPQNDKSPVLTIPQYGTYDEALEFALRHVDWLAQRMAQKGDVITLAPGAVMPIRGIDHVLKASHASRGVVKVALCDRTSSQPQLIVPGDIAYFERRVIDWCKKQARQDITAACAYHANNLGLHYRSISIRDQRTRWGSCSSEGRLNFSWRLILAPPEVLDYVAAHEVAHLQEMNHRPQFWALVEKTCPKMAQHRAWLKKNGASLHTYG